MTFSEPNANKGQSALGIFSPFKIKVESFLLKDLWPEGCDSSNNDKVTLEIYEGWIEPFQGTNINEVNFHFQSEQLSRYSCRIYCS